MYIDQDQIWIQSEKLIKGFEMYKLIRSLIYVNPAWIGKDLPKYASYHLGNGLISFGEFFYMGLMLTQYKNRLLQK